MLKKSFIFLLLIFQNFLITAQQGTKMLPYQDYRLPVRTRVADLLSRMTLEEKLSQMVSRIPKDLPRLDIPSYLWGGEAGHCVIARANDYATIFPVGIAQAASWNRKMVWQVADAMSSEARPRFHAGLNKSTLTFWAPVVEMARDPRWGRTEECYGEDPFLTSQLSLAFTRGIQGNHPKYLKAIAAPKHFALNNEEWCRHNGNSIVDEVLLREYYLKPYQVLVQEGRVEQIMAAYNRLNGVPCAANKELLTGILRKEWGFEGNVVSDCNGLKDFVEGHNIVKTPQEAVALALNAGMDIECGDYFKDYLAAVVKNGMVPMAIIDSAVTRLMVSRFKMGLYDPPDLVPYTKIPMSVVDGPQHREIAREAARQSIVLLKNSGSLLPLDKFKINSVAVIGPGAKVPQIGGYSGGYSKAVSPFEGIAHKMDSTRVTFVKGTDIKINLPVIPSEFLIPAGAKSGEHGLKGQYFKEVDCSGAVVFERTDALVDFDFGKGSPDPRIPVNYFSIRWTGKLVAPVSGAYYIGGEFDDAVRLYIDGKKIIDRTNNRNTSSDAVKVEVQKGKQYDLRLEYNEQWHTAKIRLGGAAPDPDKFKEAIRAAQQSDVAVVVVGTDETVEKEGVDRANMDLPGDQEDLVKAVLQANPRTIMVMQNGGAMSVNWANEHVPAILETWYGGEETGNAIADVLFGDYNPAGRLPMTFYKSINDLPSISDYDIRKGRTYMYPNFLDKNGLLVQRNILYPFGFGLSYTGFHYSNLRIAPTHTNSGGKITIQVDIKNTGTLGGDEVVQIYIADKKPGLLKPEKKLVAFERVNIMPGLAKTVELVLEANELAIWNLRKKKFVLEPGAFLIMVGSSSKDIRLRGSFVIK